MFEPRSWRYRTYCTRACAFADGACRNRKPRTVFPYSKVYFRACRACCRRFVARNRAGSLCGREECARLDARRVAREADEAAKPLIERTCAECLTVFVPGYGVKFRTYCSIQCQHRRVRRIAKAARRHRESARDRFDPFEVFERDGWRCRICGVDTPRRLRGTYEPNAPELDHIVPLAKGGPHTRANVQCACRRCNAEKSDSLPVGTVLEQESRQPEGFTMNQQETEQFAAWRMHAAHLHNALDSLLTEVNVSELHLGRDLLPDGLRDDVTAALEQSEPGVKDLLAEADRDAKLVACRAELQSRGDTLAQVTVRLSKIEAAGRKVVEAHREWEPQVSGVMELETAIDVLDEALK